MENKIIRSSTIEELEKGLNKMKLESGKKYNVDSRYFNNRQLIVLVEENKLPSYKFSAKQVFEIVDGNLIPSNVLVREVWLETGVAYHYDCYCNLVSEYTP